MPADALPLGAVPSSPAPRRLPVLLPGAVAAALTAASVVLLVLDRVGAVAVLDVVALLLLAVPAASPLASVVTGWTLRRRAAALGVGYRDAAAARTAGLVDAVLLRAPGLLTTGEREVASIHALDPDHERSLRWFAGALAHSGDDPVLRAVSRLAGQGRVTQVRQESDLGLCGDVDRHPVRVGRPDWLGLTAAEREAVGVEVDGRPLGTIAVRPVAVDGADAWLEEARAHGVEPLLGTAPDPHVARDLASRLPVRLVEAATGPERTAVVAGLRAEGRTVAVVGVGDDDAGLREAALAVRRTEPDATTPADADLVLRSGDVSTLLAGLLLPRSCAPAAHRARTLAVVPVAVGPLVGLGWLPAAVLPAAVVVALGLLVVASWRGVGLPR